MRVDILLAAVVALAAVAGWTAWESSMAARLRRDRRPLVARNAAVAGAHRLSVVAHLGLVGLAVALAALVQVPLWWSPVAVADPTTGAGVTVALLLVAVGCVVWAARRNRLPQDRRTLLAVVATAVATEVVLRGLLLGLLDAAAWPVTAAVLLAAVLTGGLQAWRATPGSRAFGFVLATVLGFALGLVVVLVGSVVAAAAIHVVVATLGVVRTLPGAGHTAGCGCGGHDHDATGTASFRTTNGGASTGPGGAAAGPTTTGVQGSDAAGPDARAVSGAASGAAAHDHASCGSTCDHAGTSACASCPLSKARV